MPTKSERTALIFVSAVILVGGAVRLVRAARGGLQPSPAAASALAHQRRVTDSMAKAPRSPPGESRGQRGGRENAPKPPPPPEPPFPIDVDRATARELEALPRIGPALAERIVAERTANGPFGSLDALDQRVRGIGPAMAAALRQFVTFSGR